MPKSMHMSMHVAFETFKQNEFFQFDIINYLGVGQPAAKTMVRR